MKYREHDIEESDQKKELQMKAQQYLDLFESEVKLYGKNAKKIGTTTLVVGGVFLAAYLIGRKVKKKKSKSFNGSPSNKLVVVASSEKESPIVKMIKEHIMLFLIALVKEKLLIYLKEAENKYEPIQ